MSEKNKDKYHTLDCSQNDDDGDVTTDEEIDQVDNKQKKKVGDAKQTNQKSATSTKKTKTKSTKKPFAFITKLRSYVPRNNYKTVEDDDETSSPKKKTTKEVVADGE